MATIALTETAREHEQRVSTVPAEFAEHDRCVRRLEMTETVERRNEGGVDDQ
jgi:hypothetical protein